MTSMIEQARQDLENKRFRGGEMAQLVQARARMVVGLDDYIATQIANAKRRVEDIDARIEAWTQERDAIAHEIIAYEDVRREMAEDHQAEAGMLSDSPGDVEVMEEDNEAAEAAAWAEQGKPKDKDPV